MKLFMFLYEFYKYSVHLMVIFKIIIVKVGIIRLIVLTCKLLYY